MSARHLASEGCPEFRRLARVSRRQLLQAGALGTLQFGLPTLLHAQAETPARRSNGFGSAKRCIFFFMWGGPSQLDTFDLKPDAPAEVRGEFQPAATNVPGTQFCEHFRHLAHHADKLAVLRSLTHDDPAHLSSGHLTLTGHLAPVVKSDADPPSGKDTPHMGSVLARLRQSNGQLPTAVTVPWLAYHPAAPGGKAPGQHGGWLGRRYDPFLVQGDPNQPDWSIPELNLPDGLSYARLDARQKLLYAIDRQRAEISDQPAITSMTHYQRQAFDLVASEKAREAFDLAQEPEKVREAYGRNIHGQCVLLARRLVERGVSLVSVNWHNDGHNFWDTHGNNFNRLKKDLIPPADRALATLLEDLSQRGLLEDTLVCWIGEFGRRPQITANNAGREHWPFCYSALLAGGGIRGGAVYGASDSQAAYPAADPLPPEDYVATVYHALGIDPHRTLADPFGRPLRFCQGKPILSLFG